MPLQTHLMGAGVFSAPERDGRRAYATAEDLRAGFDEWMAKEGWDLVDKMREQPPVASWHSLLNVPDRSNRIVSLMPVGNQVVAELVCTWTEDGVLQETAWVVILIYDVDGTVLQDRSYIDWANWPSANLRKAKKRLRGPKDLPEAAIPKGPPNTTGAIESFYEYSRGLQTGVSFTDLERQNLSIVEGAWVDARNGGLDSGVFHPDRFRMQLPLQKCSYNLSIARDIEAVVNKAAPDRKIRTGMTYAKGNQVAAECVVSWTEDGIDKESPFISFLLLDDDSLIIRERSYMTMVNWPGADRMIELLGL